MTFDPALAREWAEVPPRFARLLARLRPSPQVVASARSTAGAAGLGWRRTARSPRALADWGSGETVRMVGGWGLGTAIGGGALRPVDLLIAAPLARRSAAIRRIESGLADRFQLIDEDAAGWLWFDPAARSTALAAGGGLRAFRARLVTPRDPSGGAADPTRQRTELDALDGALAGKARDLIRLLKAWARARAVPASGFALERIACAFLSVWLYRRQSALFYDWMARDCFFWIASQVGASIPAQGGAVVIEPTWAAAARDSWRIAAVASDCERDRDHAGAGERWRLLFGDSAPSCAAPALSLL